MPSDDEDPLEHADVGETVTVTREKTLHSINFDPDVYYGGDRVGESDVVDARLVENEYGNHDIVVTFEGDLTKTLPRRWDQCEEPRTEREEQREQKRQWRKKWSRRLSLAIGTVISIVVATFVTHRVMSRVAGEPPYEEITAPGLGEVAGMAGGLLLFALFTMWAIQRLPRGAGGRYA
jgi:hypothetical protein